LEQLNRKRGKKKDGVRREKKQKKNRRKEREKRSLFLVLKYVLIFLDLSVLFLWFKFIQISKERVCEREKT
jgi:cytoskeletal protein RodZ